MNKYLEKSIEKYGSLENSLTNDPNWIKLGRFYNSNNERISILVHDDNDDIYYLRNKKTKEFLEIDNYEKLVPFLKEETKKRFPKMPILAKTSMAIFSKMNSNRSVGHILSRGIHDFINLIPELTDRDTLKHLKNFGYNFQDINDILSNSNENNLKPSIKKDEHLEVFLPHSFEDISDSIRSIVVHQKTKKMIQKSYSQKYRNLLDKASFKLISLLVEQDVSISEFKDNFASKIKRFDSVEDHNDHLNSYLNSFTNWTLEETKEKALALGVDPTTIREKDNRLCLRIDNYDQSKELGSGQWCISYDEHHFKNYKRNGNGIYFLYDFNLTTDNEESMIGATISQYGGVEDSHLRNDEEAELDDDNINFSGFRFKDVFPKDIEKEELFLNLKSSIYSEDDLNEKTRIAFLYSEKHSDASLLSALMDDDQLSKTLNPHFSKELSNFYFNPSKIEKTTNVLFNKMSRDFCEKYLDYINVAHYIDNSNKFKDSKHVIDFPQKILMNNDFDLFEKFLNKVDFFDGASSLDSILAYIGEPESIRSLIKICKNIKEDKSIDLLFNPSFLWKDLLKFSERNQLDLRDNMEHISIIKDILDLNDNKVIIQNILYKGLSYSDKEVDEDKKNNLKNLFSIILDSVDRESLAFEWDSIEFLYKFKDENIFYKETIENRLNEKPKTKQKLKLGQ